MAVISLSQGLDPRPASTSNDLLKRPSSDASNLLEECFEAGPDVLLNKKVVDLILTQVAQVSTEETCLVLARQILLYLHTEVSNAKVCDAIFQKAAGEISGYLSFHVNVYSALQS